MCSTASSSPLTTSMVHSRLPYSVRSDLAGGGPNVRCLLNDGPAKIFTCTRAGTWKMDNNSSYVFISSRQCGWPTHIPLHSWAWCRLPRRTCRNSTCHCLQCCPAGPRESAEFPWRCKPTGSRIWRPSLINNFHVCTKLPKRIKNEKQIRRAHSVYVQGYNSRLILGNSIEGN